MAILEEVEEEIYVMNKKKLWVRKWINRRDDLGATNCLLKELALEDPKEYLDCLRMSESCLNFLLMKMQSQIQRKDTHLRCAIPAVTKLQAVLYFLATGCSLRTLTHIFRLGKSTISEFLIEVCEAIYETLKEFLMVSLNIPEINKHLFINGIFLILKLNYKFMFNYNECCVCSDVSLSTLAFSIAAMIKSLGVILNTEKDSVACGGCSSKLSFELYGESVYGDSDVLSMLFRRCCRRILFK